MTKREKEIFGVVKKITGFGRKAHPQTIGRGMGISSDYAEFLFLAMERKGHFVKNGIYYEIALGK